jgi:DNA-binding NtrC family response regulator
MGMLERIGLVGKSTKMQYVYKLIKEAANTNVTVIIEGETGVGKELIAKAIHRISPRNKEGFITVNCGAIPVELAESELFGHEKGAFTSAIQQRIGKFEAVMNGTILLDEISELPMHIQVKLLHVLENKTIVRIGSNKEIPINTRVIAATNKPLWTEVQYGRFREDLYYRLSELVIHVPPLRERKEDIPVLSEYFIQLANVEFNKNVSKITQPALDILMQYDWYGNVRELKNVIRRAVIFTRDSQIKPQDIIIRGNNNHQYDSIDNDNFITFPVNISLEELEKRYIEHLLKMYDGNKHMVAEIAKIGLTTVYRKLQRSSV